MLDAFEFPRDVSVQALVAAVVLRTPRATAFQVNANGQPPDTELRKSQLTIGTGKGNPIVAADGFGQSVLSKKPLKTRLHRRGAGIGQRPQFEYIATVFIAHASTARIGPPDRATSL